MEFNLDEMTAEELDELLQKIQEKLNQLENPDENPEEDPETREDEPDEIMDKLTDDLDELEKLIDQVEGRKAAIKDAAEKRSKLIARIASGEAGQKVVRTFAENVKEGLKMENRFAVNSPEYREAFLKNLQGKELTAEERTAVTASAAIPTETANKIWGKLELYPLLNAIDVMHIPGNVILPVEGTINDAAVVAMGTAATDSADTLAPISLGAFKLIKTVEITADVKAMAIPAFEDWLVDRLANKIFRLVASKVAAGAGTTEPTGLTAISATGHTYTKAAITYADILAIIASLPGEYAPGAAFVMSRATFYQNVLAVQDTANHPIVVQDVQAPAKFNIMGYPVIIEDAIGTDIVFGDLKEGYVWNFSMDPNVERDTSVGFRTGSTVFRTMALGDGKPTGVGLVRYTKAT